MAIYGVSYYGIGVYGENINVLNTPYIIEVISSGLITPILDRSGNSLIRPYVNSTRGILITPSLYFNVSNILSIPILLNNGNLITPLIISSTRISLS